MARPRANNEPEGPTIRHRTRIRPVIPNPTAPLNILDSDQTHRDTSTPISEGTTIRCLRVAFGETPVKLRELEAGWRARRRMSAEGTGTRANKSMGAKGGNDHMRQGRSQRNIGASAGPSDYGQAGQGVRTVNPLSPHVIRPARKVSLVESAPIANDSNHILPNSSQRGAGPPADRRDRIRLPAIAPPSPPLTPPPIIQHKQANDPLRPAARLPDPSHSVYIDRLTSPIIGSPLPPTHQPVRLTSRSSDTIHVHPPDSPTAITLLVRTKSLIIHISHNGETIDIVPRQKAVAAPQRRLTMSEWGKWSEVDRRDWDLVKRLVEGYKLNTPRVKLYLPLGHLVLTCSTPPDVLLHFEHTYPAVNEGDNENVTLTRVRVRLSRIRVEITVDTSTTTTSEKLRTKRTVRLHMPDDTMDRGLSKTVKDLKQILERTREWSQAEREGLKRMYEMREEWGFYG